MGEEFFLIANSDTILDFDLKKAIRFHRAKKAVATMVLFPYLDERYTPVYLDENYRLVSIGKKPEAYYFHGFYTGVSLLSPAIIDLLPDGKSCIIENAIIPARRKGLPVCGYMTEGLFFEVHGNTRRGRASIPRKNICHPPRVYRPWRNVRRECYHRSLRFHRSGSDHRRGGNP
jgi:NDP-sugar pyrophosphorylase family protein